MIVRIKRQSDCKSPAYWQSFEYNGTIDTTVVAVINAINYTDDIYDIEGNHAERIRWECSCMQGVCGGCAMIINGKPFSDWIWLKVSDMFIFTSILLLVIAFGAVVFGATRYIRRERK